MSLEKSTRAGSCATAPVETSIVLISWGIRSGSTFKIEEPVICDAQMTVSVKEAAKDIVKALCTEGGSLSGSHGINETSAQGQHCLEKAFLEIFDTTIKDCIHSSG